MKSMTSEQWKDYLGADKFSELQRIAENPLALEALEDVMCIEARQDNFAAPGRPADANGNYLFQMLLQNAPSDDQLLKEMRAYAVALQLIQNGVKTVEGFKKKPEKVEETKNPAV